MAAGRRSRAARTRRVALEAAARDSDRGDGFPEVFRRRLATRRRSRTPGSREQDLGRQVGQFPSEADAPGDDHGGGALQAFSRPVLSSDLQTSRNFDLPAGASRTPVSARRRGRGSDPVFGQDGEARPEHVPLLKVAHLRHLEKKSGKILKYRVRRSDLVPRRAPACSPATAAVEQKRGVQWNDSPSRTDRPATERLLPVDLPGGLNLRSLGDSRRPERDS